jgi:hypothetical protein
MGITSPIIATMWVKHEGLGFDGRVIKNMIMKNIFMKEKDVPELDDSSGERTIVSEGGSPLPP